MESSSAASGSLCDLEQASRSASSASVSMPGRCVIPGLRFPLQFEFRESVGVALLVLCRGALVPSSGSGSPPPGHHPGLAPGQKPSDPGSPLKPREVSTRGNTLQGKRISKSFGHSASGSSSGWEPEGCPFCILLQWAEGGKGAFYGTPTT